VNAGDEMFAVRRGEIQHDAFLDYFYEQSYQVYADVVEMEMAAPGWYYAVPFFDAWGRIVKSYHLSICCESPQNP
jgi:hypothetical protein